MTAYNVNWAGSDAASGATLKAAVELCAPGDSVNVGAGTFALGLNHIAEIVGVAVTGAGKAATIVTSTKPSTGSPLSSGIFNLGSGSSVSNLKVYGTIAYIGTIVYQIPIRTEAAGTVVLINVVTEAWSDGLYVFGPTTVYCTGCDFVAGFDCVNVTHVQDNAPGEYANIVFHACTFTSSTSLSNGHSVARTLSTFGNTHFWLFDCTLNAVSTGTDPARGVSLYNYPPDSLDWLPSEAYLTDCTISTTGSDAYSMITGLQGGTEGGDQNHIYHRNCTVTGATDGNITEGFMANRYAHADIDSDAASWFNQAVGGTGGLSIASGDDCFSNGNNVNWKQTAGDYTLHDGRAELGGFSVGALSTLSGTITIASDGELGVTGPFDHAGALVIYGTLAFDGAGTLVVQDTIVVKGGGDIGGLGTTSGSADLNCWVTITIELGGEVSFENGLCILAGGWVVNDGGAIVIGGQEFYGSTAIAASADVRSGVPRWTGATGADLGTAETTNLGPFPAGLSQLGPFPVLADAIGPYPVEA